jgi:hypothetical protein
MNSKQPIDSGEVPQASPRADDNQVGRKSQVPERLSAPRAGRVGTLGARAERPEDKRKPPVPVPGGRGGKAPSAAEPAPASSKDA